MTGEIRPKLHRSGVRFTITTPAGPSTVLEASVNATGSVIVKPRTAQFKRPDPRVNFADRAIIESHCTIHPSRRSPDGNLIHFTTLHDEGPSFEMHLFTQAIKKTRRFAPLFMARVANPMWNMRSEEPLKSDTRIVPLGLLKPDAFTLFYFVLVGPRDRIFIRSDMNLDTNVKQETIGDISLVLLWSFLCHSSHNTGDTFHVGSTKEPEGLESEALNLMRLVQHGITDFQVMLHWVAGRDLIVENFREMLKREHAAFPLNLAFLEWLRFFELGILTDQYHRYLMRFARNRGIPAELIKVPESYRQFERRPLVVPTSMNLRDRLRRWRGARDHSDTRWEPWFTEQSEEAIDVSTTILP